MAKISVDLKTSDRSGKLPKEQILTPTLCEAMRAYTGALLTTELIGKAADLLEVIKIGFSQWNGDELDVRLTAIMSDGQGIKFEAHTTDINLYLDVHSDPKSMAIELLHAIKNAIANRIENVKSCTELLEESARSLLETHDYYYYRWFPYAEVHFSCGAGDAYED